MLAKFSKLTASKFLFQFQPTNLRPPGHPQQFPGAPHQFMPSGVHNPGGPHQQIFYTQGMQGMAPMPQYHQVPLTFPQQHPVPLPGQMIHFQQPHMGQMQPHLIQQPQQPQQQPQQQQPTGPAPGGQQRPLPTPTPPNQVGPQPALSIPQVGGPPNSMMAPNIPPQMMTFPQPMQPAGVIRPSVTLPPKRRSHAIQIVDPDSGTVIDPLAGKPTPDNVASLTSHAEESGTEVTRNRFQIVVAISSILCSFFLAIGLSSQSKENCLWITFCLHTSLKTIKSTFNFSRVFFQLNFNNLIYLHFRRLLPH